MANTRFFFPLLRYWEAQTREEERAAYAVLLSLGAPPSYGESPEDVDAILARHNLTRWKEPKDILAITRDVAVNRE